MEEKTLHTEVRVESEPAADDAEFRCDRCGSQMIERNCKLVCPNCGGRLDCSDLNLHFD